MTFFLIALRRIALAAATGFIFMFYSERVFWSYWRRDDTLPGVLLTWISYSIVAEICLIAIRVFRVRSIPALFLVGALFGWLIEGVLAMTLFGADGIPFPLTISWTGLAWHALLTFMLGWFGMQMILRGSLRDVVLAASVAGLFWGLWALAWLSENTTVAPVPAFALHGFATTAALIVAYYVYPKLKASGLQISHIEILILAATVGAYFIVVTVPATGFLAAIVPVLFALVFFGLHANAKQETRADFLFVPDAKIPMLNALAVFCMPLTATVAYASQIALPTHIITLAITLPVGAFGFAASLWKLLRKPR